MRFLLLISTLTIWGCAPREPKFHYSQQVVVTRGFYQSCTGVIVSLEREKSQALLDLRPGNIYKLEMVCSGNSSRTVDIEESELEALTK
jgi:hypothetical protein